MDLNKVLFDMEKIALKTGFMLYRNQASAKSLKTSKDFLSDMDEKAEELILQALEKEYPQIPALSEEKGGMRITDGLQWVIDPIDGTLNYFLQDDHWGVSIALVENSHPIAGVVYLPSKRLLYSTTFESDACVYVQDEWFRIGSKLQVNQNNSLPQSQFWVGWGKELRGGADHEVVYNAIKKLDKISLYPQIRNSCIADMMKVANGNITGYVFPKPEPYDIAAAGLIVERAGGKVTDIHGEPWSAFSESLVATNGLLHESVLLAIR